MLAEVENSSHHNFFFAMAQVKGQGVTATLSQNCEECSDAMLLKFYLILQSFKNHYMG
jgi:hypothetical protein